MLNEIPRLSCLPACTLYCCGHVERPLQSAVSFPGCWYLCVMDVCGVLEAGGGGGRGSWRDELGGWWNTACVSKKEALR